MSTTRGIVFGDSVPEHVDGGSLSLELVRCGDFVREKVCLSSGAQFIGDICSTNSVKEAESIRYTRCVKLARYLPASSVESKTGCHCTRRTEKSDSKKTEHRSKRGTKGMGCGRPGRVKFRFHKTVSFKRYSTPDDRNGISISKFPTCGNRNVTQRQL